MPISGVVIAAKPAATENVARILTEFTGLEVHGHDEKGNIVAVLDTETSEEMERLIDAINELDDVINVGVTYLNTEDEASRMADGEKLAKPFGFKRTIES